jgi:hypothetical protein
MDCDELSLPHVHGTPVIRLGVPQLWKSTRCNWLVVVLLERTASGINPD